MFFVFYFYFFTFISISILYFWERVPVFFSSRNECLIMEWRHGDEVAEW